LNIHDAKETLVNRIVYIVGAIVIIIALLSFFGLR
jgi:predicted membrane channel-forming protein YqfA (hemolysin III family)